MAVFSDVLCEAIKWLFVLNNIFPNTQCHSLCTVTDEHLSTTVQKNSYLNLYEVIILASQYNKGFQGINSRAFSHSIMVVSYVILPSPHRTLLRTKTKASRLSRKRQLIRMQNRLFVILHLFDFKVKPQATFLQHWIFFCVNVS